MIFYRRVDRAKPLLRRSSESNLPSLKEVPDEATDDTGPRASAIESTDTAEHLGRSRANSSEKKPISISVNHFSIDMDRQSSHPTPMQRSKAVEVSSPMDKGKGTDRTHDALQAHGLVEDGQSPQGSDSPTHSTTHDSDSRESEKSWVKAESLE